MAYVRVSYARNTSLTELNRAMNQNALYIAEAIAFQTVREDNLVKVLETDIAGTLDSKFLAGDGFENNISLGGPYGAVLIQTVLTPGDTIDASPGNLKVGVLNDENHGNRAGGDLHPLATPQSAGFMSTQDKTVADLIIIAYGFIYRTVQVSVTPPVAPATQILLFDTAGESQNTTLIPASGIIRMFQKGLWQIEFNMTAEKTTGTSDELYISFVKKPAGAPPVTLPQVRLVKYFDRFLPLTTLHFSATLMEEFDNGDEVWVEISSRSGGAFFFESGNLSAQKIGD